MSHSIDLTDLKISFDGKVMYDPLPQQRKFHLSPAKYRLIGGAVGGGKRLSAETKVFTDNGWKRADKVTYGDRLLAPDGTYTEILGIYPHRNMPTYRMTFSDGRWVDVDAEHLWKVRGQKHGARDGWLLKTTEEILNIKERQVIPLCKAAPGEKWDGPDPYICGLLLGDGTLTGHHTTVYSVDEEIINYLQELGWHIYKYESQNTTMCQYFQEDFRDILGRVSGKDKRVPEDLLMADAKTRLLVLQGLMDTDGHCDKSRTAGCSFTNKSEGLCENLIYLVRSLGGKATLHRIERGPRSVKGYKTDGKYFRVNISHLGKFNPFKMSRKAERVNPKQKGGRLGIKSIEKIDNTDGVCFEVQHPSHLYVVKDFIVTHNTMAIMAEAILRSLKYDFPLTGAIFRRSFPELDATIIRNMLQMLPTWFYKYNQQQHVMTFKNGSIIEFCYAETDNDVIRYQSREWDWLAIDELTHLSEYQFTYLGTRVRTVKPINTKIFAGSNPGGRGHSFAKERFVTKDCKVENYNPKDYDFIPAGIKDNPYLMKNNPDYLENLKMLPEDERKRLLDGDWDAQSGMFFTEWSPTRHVVDDFDVPENWQIIMGWDDGTREPRSVHLYAIDNDQRVWCIWEYYHKEENLTEAADKIKRILQEKQLWGRVYKCVVDPSMKRMDSQTGLSSIDVLESMGYGFNIGNVELGNNKRVEGWRVMKSYLSHKPYEEPLLKFFKSCKNIIRTIPELMYYEPRSGAASKKEDLDCFIAGTQVDTLKGRKNIEDIGRGDLIRTPIGYKKVVKDGISGISSTTSWAELSNGERLEGTPDHKIFIKNKGLVELQNVSVGDILQSKNIYLWKPKRLNTTEYFIVDTLLADIIARTEVILGRVTPLFIGRFISIILDLSQKVWQSTTRMATSITTIFQTLNYSTIQYTANFTTKRGKIYRRNLKSGGSQQKAGKPLGKMQERCMSERQKYPVRARIVERLLKRKKSRKNIALKDVSMNIEFLYRSLRSVPFVGKLLGQLTRKLRPVRISAVGSCGNPKMVYNLTVNEAHLYYANGVLVTNTTQEDHSADDCRYALMSLDRLPSRFESSTYIEVKKREYNPKTIY